MAAEPTAEEGLEHAITGGQWIRPGCPWCGGSGRYWRSNTESVPCRCGPPVTGVCIGEYAPNESLAPTKRTAPNGLHHDFIAALKAGGAVYCLSCREYLDPEHTCGSPERRAADAPATSEAIQNAQAAEGATEDEAPGGGGEAATGHGNGSH
jgi:hypothetical protein